MKFICNKCHDDDVSDHPCFLIIKGAKQLKYDRENWRAALRRCPFENDDNGEFNGKTTIADWRKVKK